MSVLEDFTAARQRLVAAANKLLDHIDTLKEAKAQLDEVQAGIADMHSVAEALEKIVAGDETEPAADTVTGGAATTPAA